jgi:hypothetical protein
MKTIFIKTLLLLITLTGLSSLVSAQKGYEVSVGRRTLNLTDSTVFVLEVHRAIEKDVIDSWKKSIEKNKVKAVIKNDQLTIKGVVLESISSTPLDLYSTAVQQDKGVKLYSVFILNGVRIDPHGKEGESVKVRKLLERFGAQVYETVLTRELKEKEEVLKELAKNRDKIIKKQNKIDQSIQKDSLNIFSTETEIGLLKGQLEGATDRYNAKKKKVATTNYATKEDAKEAKADLKLLDKERKDVEKEIQKNSKAILSYKAQIRDYWYELKQLKADELSLEQKLEEQRMVVKLAEEELNQ